MTNRIEHAVLEDAPAIWALQRLAYQSEAVLNDDWSIPPLTQTLEALIEEFPGFTVIKAVTAGQLVGTVRARVVQEACEISRLMVHPSMQQRGIGSSLLKAIEGAFPEAAKFKLFTGGKSARNIRLYQQAGYRITRTEAIAPGASLVFLEKLRPS